MINIHAISDVLACRTMYIPSPNAIMSPDLTDVVGLEGERRDGGGRVNVNGGGRKERGDEAYTYTLGIYRSQADSVLRALAAVPAGPMVSDKGNWLLPTHSLFNFSCRTPRG